MPYITPGATKKSTGDNFQLRMRPSYTKAMIELIKYYKWKEIHYIYDSDEGRCFCLTIDVAVIVMCVSILYKQQSKNKNEGRKVIVVL